MDLLYIFEGNMGRVNDLKSICSCQKCTCGCFQILIPFNQMEYTIGFLIGLNDSYSHIGGKILLSTSDNRQCILSDFAGKAAAVHRRTNYEAYPNHGRNCIHHQKRENSHKWNPRFKKQQREEAILHGFQLSWAHQRQML